MTFLYLAPRWVLVWVLCSHLFACILLACFHSCLCVPLYMFVVFVFVLVCNVCLELLVHSVGCLILVFDYHSLETVELR